MSLIAANMLGGGGLAGDALATGASSNLFNIQSMLPFLQGLGSALNQGQRAAPPPPPPAPALGGGFFRGPVRLPAPLPNPRNIPYGGFL